METIIHYLYSLIEASGAIAEDGSGDVDESKVVKLGNFTVTVGEIYQTISKLED